MTTIDITAEQRQQYLDEGYFILERVLTDDQLDLLREVADYAVAKVDREMDEQGVDRLGLSSKGRRYFSTMIYRDRPELRSFLFSETMADICRATLGEEAFLFWEQYVIKAGDPDTTFAWHQDSGYVHEDHEPYLTCWIALDDITMENGPVFLLPYSRSGIRSYIKHIRDDSVNDQVCYFGSDPGLPALVPAGSIVVFSSTVIHRSGPNLTDRFRRVYLAQYSAEVIRSKDGKDTWGSFEPIVHQGRTVVPDDVTAAVAVG